jgi:3-dehydroquinate dehydratase type I
VRIVGKICTVVTAMDVQEMRRKAEHAFSLGSGLVEFRIDLLDSLNVSEIIKNLSNFSSRCIMTVRSKREGGRFKGKESNRLELLKQLSEMKPAYTDIELEAAKKFPDELNKIARNSGNTIISWHNFIETPELASLKRIYKEVRSFGEIAKIVTTARRIEDNVRILSLYTDPNKSDLIAFCMGEKGILSRVLCMYKGSPLSYASLPNENVAPGQLSIKVMKEIIGEIG